MPIPSEDSPDFVGPPSPKPTSGPRRKKKGAKIRAPKPRAKPKGDASKLEKHGKMGEASLVHKHGSAKKPSVAQTLTSIAAARSGQSSKTKVGAAITGGLAGAALGATIDESRRASSKKKKKQKKDGSEAK